jgi:hypothetical protein
MSHMMPRNCNYTNMDRVIEQARYDEERNQYILPEPTKEDVQFPQMGTTNGRTLPNDHMIPSKSISTPPTTEYEDDFVNPTQDGYQNQYSTTSNEEIERRYGRNLDPPNLPSEKTRIRRQEQLLNENSLLQRTKRPLQMNNDNDYMNRRLNTYEAPPRLSRKYGFSSDKQ